MSERINDEPAMQGPTETITDALRRNYAELRYARARIAELEAEVAAARARIADEYKDATQLAEGVVRYRDEAESLRARIAELEQAVMDAEHLCKWLLQGDTSEADKERVVRENGINFAAALEPAEPPTEGKRL